MNLSTLPKLFRNSAVGAFIFGVGWEISGLCPGPILASSSNGASSVLILAVCMMIGLHLASMMTTSKKQR